MSADDSFLRVSFGLEEDAIEADNYSVDNWCFCKQSQNSKLMLCCDFCDTWYHADCVGISKVKVTKMMEDREKYKCAFCKDKENEAKEKEKKQKLREYMGTGESANDNEFCNELGRQGGKNVGVPETVEEDGVSSSSALSPTTDGGSAEITFSSAAEKDNVSPSIKGNGDEDADESNGASQSLVPTKAVKSENVVKVEADSTDLEEKPMALSAKSGAIANSNVTAKANEDASSDGDEDEKLSDMKPMVLPPSPKDQKSKSADDSSSDDSSDGDSSSSSDDSSSSDSSDSSSSDDDSSPVKKLPIKGKGGVTDSAPKQTAAQRKRLNTLYKNSPKLKLFCSVTLDRLAPTIVDRCAIGERLEIQEVNRLIQSHKNNIQKGGKSSSKDLAAIGVSSKKKTSLTLGLDLKDIASDSDSSDDEKRVKSLMPPPKSESKFKPLIKNEQSDPIANISSDKELNEEPSSSAVVVKKELEVKEGNEDFSKEELIKAGLEVSTVPSEATSAVVSFLDEKSSAAKLSFPPDGKKISKKTIVSSSEDEYIEPENDSPKKTPSPKVKKEKKEKKKKKVVRASSSSDDDVPKQIDRKAIVSAKSGKGSARMDDSDNYLEPVDDENKLRLLEEDLFKKPKKSKKEEKPTLSSTKPPSKIIRAAADAGQSSSREDPYERATSPGKKSKSSNSSKSSSSIPSGSGAARRCIVPMCGKEVKLNGDSNFCSKPCIKRHVQKFYDAVGYKKNKETSAESIQNPEVSSSQDRIRVRLIDKSASITVEGANAPNVAEIYSWLRRNPTFEIVMPPKKQAEVDEQFRNQSKQALRRKMVEVNSLGARMGRSVPGHALHKIVDDFESVLWHFNEKEINKHYKECFARINHYIEANRDLFDWIVNGKLTSEHLVMMTDDEYKKVGTNKFISFTPQSDFFPRNKKCNFGDNDILARLTGDTTSGHGKTHEYSLQCKICKNSGEKSMLEAKEREKIRRKAEVKTLFSKHKNFCCPPNCKFCSIASADHLRAEHDMQIGMNGGKCSNPKCRFCEMKELEEDYNASNKFGQTMNRNDEVSNALSEQTQDDNSDDRLFGAGRVTGGAGLLNEVDDSAPADATPVDSKISFGLNDPVDNTNATAPEMLNLRPPSPSVPYPQKAPRELCYVPAPISPVLDDGPPPLKKVAVSPPPLKSLGGNSPPLSPPPILWEGNFIVSEEKHFKVNLLPLNGMVKDIEKDLSAQIMVKGRLQKETVFDYIRKVHSRRKLGIAVLELGLPRDERDKNLYRHHCEFLLAKNQFSGTAQNPPAIREMYILAVGANEAFPSSEFGSHVNLRHPRRDMLLAIIIRNKSPNPPNPASSIGVSQPLRPASDERRHDNSNRAMRKELPQNFGSTDSEKRMNDVYRNVISNPGRSVNEILSAVPVAAANRLPSSNPPKAPPSERLYPESNSSSFPFFREELMQSGCNNGANSSHDKGKRSSTEMEDSSNWRRERDNYGALPSSNSGASVLGRFKDDHLKTLTNSFEDRKGDDYLNQLYKPVGIRGASPPPLPPPDESRPPLPAEPHPYHNDVSKRMRLEYGGAPSDDRTGHRFPDMKRPAELMGYQDRTHRQGGIHIYRGGGDNRRMISPLERAPSSAGAYSNGGSYARFDPTMAPSESASVRDRFRSCYN